MEPVLVGDVAVCFCNIRSRMGRDGFDLTGSLKCYDFGSAAGEVFGNERQNGLWDCRT